MSNFCGVISKITPQPYPPPSSQYKVTFDELDLKTRLYEKEVIKFHAAFSRQSEFICRSYFEIFNNEQQIMKIQRNIEIQMEALRDIEILIYIIENELHIVETSLQQLLGKLGPDIEFINLPITTRGHIYLWLVLAAGYMHEILDGVTEFYKQSNHFLAQSNIMNTILNIHVSLLQSLEKSTWKLLEMIQAIDAMCAYTVVDRKLKMSSNQTHKVI